ncbi:unnamed protein product [Clonostachys rhizophaga]|uniref:Metal ion transporter C27B12.12c n=1 Tax=Clonostachys rhizophaga TaxID=160324 RepID=A0A9N9V7Q9_9HYPO|nr:unnamed protein product [Clonostachys rhizophaga]
MSSERRSLQAAEGNASLRPASDNARTPTPSPTRRTSPAIIVRDFENAVVHNYDHDDDNVDPLSPRVRRGTWTKEISDPRSASPPSSVKAFAASRRRSRRNTFSSEARSEFEEHLARIGSISEARSISPGQEVRHPSVAPVDDAGIHLPNIEDRDEYRDEADGEYAKEKEQLCIDFEFLEQFMHAEPGAHMNHRLSSDAAPRVFSDLRRSQSGNEKFTTNSEGDLILMQPPGSPDFEEKKKPSIIPPAQIERSRFTFCSSSSDSTLSASELVDLVPCGETIRSLFEQSVDEDGSWWLNCTNVSRAEVQGLGKAFGIHPLTVEDIITNEPHEKVELFNSYYFASFQSFHAVEEDGGIEYQGFSIYLLIFRQGVLSFSFVPNAHASYVRNKMMALKGSVSVSSDWICYAIVDHIVDQFGPVIRRMEAEVDSIDDDVFIMRDDDKNTILKRIGQARKNCMALFRLLAGKADVLGGFTKRCNENYPMAPRMDIGMYLSDIQDHVVTMTSNISHFETILARAHSNYLATLSISNHSQAHMTNRVLNKVTLLAGVFVPLQLVSSLFGMNVPVPWAGSSSNNLAPFFGITGFMLGFALLFVAVARFLRFL